MNKNIKMNKKNSEKHVQNWTSKKKVKTNIRINQRMALTVEILTVSSIANSKIRYEKTFF